MRKIATIDRKKSNAWQCELCYVSSMKYRLLLVDDDPLVLGAFQMVLKREGYEVDTCDSGPGAVEMVKRQPGEYALIILDYHLGQTKGPAVIQSLREISPNLFILIHSGDESREVLKSTWAAGAMGFLEKGSLDMNAHLLAIRGWCQKYEETQRILNCQSPEKSDWIPALGLVGRSAAMQMIGGKVGRYREMDQNVLVLGETGTGKEIIARALHRGEGESFFPVNCAAYKSNTELLESELFGHEKGSFTGALSDKRGIFEQCNGGTVFLDEIHHLSDAAQAKLLRVCQEKRIRRVGSQKEIVVRFRLIASAKPNLEALCESGEFLRDLYHRLNVFFLSIPPLRERREDVEPLVAYFCRKYADSTGTHKTFLMQSVRHLSQYGWPGNVRELENTVYRLLTDCPGDQVEPNQLDGRFFSGRRQLEVVTLDTLKERQALEERSLLEKVLRESSSKTDAAQKLNISPSTLHSIMKRHQLYNQV